MKIPESDRSPNRLGSRIPDISNYHPDPRTGPPVAFRLPFETLSRATSRAGERHAERGETVGSWLTCGGAALGAAGVELEGGAGGGRARSARSDPARSAPAGPGPPCGRPQGIRGSG